MYGGPTSLEQELAMIIYLIRNRVNGKVYIGKFQAHDVQRRWRYHQKAAARGSRNCFHAAIRKYGHKAFSIEILCYAKDKLELIELEKHYIAKYKSYPPQAGFGYNMTLGGDGIVGLKQSAEHRRKLGLAISKALNGRKLSASHKRNIGDAIRGKNVAAGTRKSPGGLAESHKLSIGKTNRHRWESSSASKRRARLAGLMTSLQERTSIVRNFPCPTCKAKQGKPCVRANGKKAKAYHKQRLVNAG
jgi:group I intron endonuclease